MADSPDRITMVKQAIHNPADLRHFMRIVAVENLVTATCQGVELARSRRACKVKEVAYDIYDAVIYFPREDVVMQHLKKNDKTTHCPLKGDTEYFDLAAGIQHVSNVAWSYNQTIEIAAALQDLIGFDARLVQLVEFTAGDQGLVA